MTRGYDVIVVGARCAGSPTAMLLARRGYRVLVVDRSTFPSDTVSTHVVHAPGIAASEGPPHGQGKLLGPADLGIGGPRGGVARRPSAALDHLVDRVR